MKSETKKTLIPTFMFNSCWSMWRQKLGEKVRYLIMVKTTVILKVEFEISKNEISSFIN